MIDSNFDEAEEVHKGDVIRDGDGEEDYCSGGHRRRRNRSWERGHGFGSSRLQRWTVERERSAGREWILLYFYGNIYKRLITKKPIFCILRMFATEGKRGNEAGGDNPPLRKYEIYI